MSSETTGLQVYANLIDEIEIPDDGTISRTLHNDAQSKVVLFGFSPGQELSEHTASMPAVIHILSGEAKLTLGKETHEAIAGAWVHMPANLPHGVLAKSKVVMLLTLMKNRG